MSKKSRDTRSGKPRGRYSVDHRAPGNDLPVVRRFRANVRTLLDEGKKLGLTQEKLAEMSQLSLRALASQVSEASPTVPNLRAIQQLADAMRIEPWQLLFPDFPAQLLLNPSLREKVHKTLERYLTAEPDARDAIDNLATLLTKQSK